MNRNDAPSVRAFTAASATFSASRTPAYLGLLALILAGFLAMLAYSLWAGQPQAVLAAEVNSRLDASLAVTAAALLALILAWVAIRTSRAEARVAAVAHQLGSRDALLRALFEQSSFLAGVLDQTGHVLEANDRSLAVIGGDREDILGCYFPDSPWCFQAENREELVQLLRQAAAGQGGSIELMHPVAGGGGMAVLFHAIPVRGGMDSLTAVIGVDITALKRAEEKLRLSDLALNAISQGVLISGPDGRIISANDAFVAITGFSKTEILGGTCRFLQGPLTDPLTVAEMRQAQENVTQFSGDVINYRKDGGTFWNELTISPVLDARGSLTQFIGVTRDVSRRKQAEAEILRSNSELEQFSYSISHDLRQPLRMITSYLQLLETSLRDTLDAERQEYFHYAIDGAKRLDAMLLGLLEHSRVGRKGEPAEWLDSRAVVADALLFLEPAIAEADARVTFSGDWPRILVSPDEMLRLTQNLIENAIKFRVAGRRPEISVAGKINGEYWRLAIADNGIGILPEQIGRLFQVFQRLQSRAVYEGNGIGLALARKIALHHGGRIWAESPGEGMGSTFVLELPLSPPGIKP